VGFSYSVQGTQAHAHTSTAGDGGSLNANTEIITNPIFPLIIAVG